MDYSFQNSIFRFIIFSLLLLPITSHAGTRNFTFIVSQTPVQRLCKTKNVITVNGQFPGPTLEVFNGDTVSVLVKNLAWPYNVTVHWHGIRQMGTAWADGPEYVTQCPIQPGRNYTYRFRIVSQEGTLWWHAHSSWLRATVYGAFVIRTNTATPPPPNLSKPDREKIIVLGEWWNANPQDVLRQASLTGAPPNASDAFTINGQPGHLYPCSAKDTVVIRTNPGDTTLLRIINAALNQELFFTVANHSLTVVAIDASDIKPFLTPVLMLPPGMTADVRIAADQMPSQYDVTVFAYESAQNVIFDTTAATAIFQYTSAASSLPVPASRPSTNDTAVATSFARNLRSLVLPPHGLLPNEIDHDLFFTVSLGMEICDPYACADTCEGPANGTRFSSSMNNVSFVLPRNVSILEAYHAGASGVFTTDFPAKPPKEFDYTGIVSRRMMAPVKGTKVYRLEFGSRVQVVLQGTSFVKSENHPMHLHGYNFYVVGQGFGNFDKKFDEPKFNLLDPPRMNTVGVPVNGWAAIRFVADNPGIWLMHCHLDFHINWGLAMAFLVENGKGEAEALNAPPIDLPQC